MMTPHGPDAKCFEKASNVELKPERVADGTQVSLSNGGTSMKMGGGGQSGAREIFRVQKVKIKNAQKNLVY